MSTPVSIVIPALGDVELLAALLRSVMPELARRAAGDLVLVVDDTGHDVLSPALATAFPAVRWLANAKNLGFAHALTAGVLAAQHELVFAMNSDVCARPGFLEPLLAALQGSEKVFAAVPRVLLRGEAGKVESLVAVRLEDGIARAAQPLLEDARARLDDARLAGTFPVPFPIGGACLFQKRVFLELGGFDPAFEPFYLEDLDLGWRAWKAGFCCVYAGASVVEHRHRATIGAAVPEAVVLAAIERNRLLFTWKHLDDPHLCEEHVAALARRVAEAAVTEDRTFLGALCLALEDRASVAVDARSARATSEPSFTRIQNASDPFQES